MGPERGGLNAIRLRRKKINISAGKLGEDKKQQKQPLSPMARVFHEPDIDLYILLIFSFKTPIDLTLFKQLMPPLLNHPRFSSLQVKDDATGKLKWVPTSVDIDNHIIVPTLDTNADSPDKVVDDYISDLSKTGIDMSRPMWEWHVLNLGTSDAESTAVLRLHHSLGDGVSLMSLLLSLAHRDSNSKPGPAVAKKPQNCTKHIGFRGCITRVWVTWLMWWNTLVAGMMFLAMLCLIVKDTETPLKSCYSCGGGRRRFVRKAISLDDVKTVKNALGVTINDVMIGVAQAGLSRYLNRKYGEAGKETTKKSNNLPINIRLTAFLVFNLRSSHGIPDLSEMMKANSKARWGNKIGLVPFPFSISLEDDPLDYVRKSKASMDRKKNSFIPLFAYLLTEPVLKFGRPIVGNFATKTTMAFSNVVGPQNEITLFGHQVTNIAATVYGLPLALVIHVVSYTDKMNMILSVDDRVIPDPHQLCHDLEESFDLIKQSVISQKSF